MAQSIESTCAACPPEVTPGYGPARGRVCVRLTAPNGGAVPGTFKAMFTEHRASQRRQHIVSLGDTAESVDLLSGTYTAQILVPGFETARRLVEVEPNRVQTIEIALVPREPRVRSFAERLAYYGLAVESLKIRSLDVPRGETMALNFMAHQNKDDYRLLSARSITDIKRWIGSDDKYFGHNAPVYGPLPDVARVTELIAKSQERAPISVSEIKLLDAVAHEYIHGNSRAVEQFSETLDTLIAVSQPQGRIRIAIFFFNIVTIGPGATLEVGNGSAVFTCDELHIHRTGTLKPVGSVKIEVGTYREFV